MSRGSSVRNAKNAEEGLGDMLNSAASGRLKSIVQRIERLNEDKAAIMADQKEIFAEAKGEGYDVKILRLVIRIRKQDKAKRQEEQSILDTYLLALGDLEGL